VRALADALGGADEIKTASDVSGPASFDYFLQELSMSFDIRVDGGTVQRTPLRSTARRFSTAGRSAALVSFPFFRLGTLSRTMGARTALTRVAIEPAWLARLLVAIVSYRRISSHGDLRGPSCHRESTPGSPVEQGHAVRAPRRCRVRWMPEVRDIRRSGPGGRGSRRSRRNGAIVDRGLCCRTRRLDA
jgi:hypothetical protein